MPISELNCWKYYVILILLHHFFDTLSWFWDWSFCCRKWFVFYGYYVSLLQHLLNAWFGSWFCILFQQQQFDQFWFTELFEISPINIYILIMLIIHFHYTIPIDKSFRIVRLKSWNNQFADNSKLKRCLITNVALVHLAFYHASICQPMNNYDRFYKHHNTTPCWAYILSWIFGQHLFFLHQYFILSVHLSFSFLVFTFRKSKVQPLFGFGNLPIALWISKAPPNLYYGLPA